AGEFAAVQSHCMGVVTSMFPCLTYLERNVRVDCEFPDSNEIPGPYCEYRQDSRLVGSTYPNTVIYVSTEDRRRSNVSLFAPNLCRLTWAPMGDEKPYTYTCRVYQGTIACVSSSLTFDEGPPKDCSDWSKGSCCRYSNPARTEEPDYVKLADLRDGRPGSERDGSFCCRYVPPIVSGCHRWALGNGPSRREELVTP
uniref:Si:ch211-215c18.3 n=1 Tax=Hippocampus comes TaxID=109280 RepID=A0A3Q2XG59_HIPCM